MSKITPPSKIETVAGDVRTEAVLTLIGAMSGNPIGALLPVLSSSLANERFKVRLNNALNDINEVLESHEKKIRSLTDGQFKLINEAVLALLQTTSSEKIQYLKHTVINSLDAPVIASEEAIILSRIIRDISAQEIDFIVKNFTYERIQLGFAQGDLPKNILIVKAGGNEELIITGLMSLGLIIPAGPTIDDGGLMRFSNSVAKLIALLKSPDM